MVADSICCDVDVSLCPGPGGGRFDKEDRDS